MSRYIDADAFLKEYCEPYPHVYKAMSRAMAEAPSIDIPQWIPCSERLPSVFSDDERVLATTDVDGLGVIIMPIYDVKSWYLKGYITAWMPLPKPYGENSSEKPNNCKVKNYCDDCLYTDTCDSKEFFYACTSKATVSKMENVDEPQTERCDTCKWEDSLECIACSKHCDLYEPKDEPQIGEMMTEEEFDSMLARVLTGKTEPQTDCAWREPDA